MGPVVSPSTIIKRLNAARDWLTLPPTVGMAGQKKHYKGTDDVIVAEIVVGCVNLLGSPRAITQAGLRSTAQRYALSTGARSVGWSSSP